MRTFWAGLSLAQQYALASTAVLVAGMLLIGWWVSHRIMDAVTDHTAVTTTLYMNNFVTPEIQELAEQETLTPARIMALDRLRHEAPLGERIVSFRIWGPGGRIVYSGNHELIGRVLPVDDDVALGFTGGVTAEFTGIGEETDVEERRLGGPLLEMYSPLRQEGSDRILAVIEFYEVADELAAKLFEANVYSWLVVGAVTLGMLGVVFGIVRRGSQTITEQRSELEAQVGELSALLAQNRELNERVRRATNRATEINERFLRRVSAELHDGPAQALGFALLRLDAIKRHIAGCDAASELERRDVDRIRGALDDALTEIRGLSSGLALPDIEELTLEKALRRAVRAHERRTGTIVELDLDKLPDDAPLPLKLSVYRLVQEALSNAFRHAGGRGQRVSVGCRGDYLAVEVMDEGPGFEPQRGDEATDTLGLQSMRERVESLGGEFTLDSAPGSGTRVSAWLPLGAVEANHD